MEFPLFPSTADTEDAFAVKQTSHSFYSSISADAHYFHSNDSTESGNTAAFVPTMMPPLPLDVVRFDEPDFRTPKQPDLYSNGRARSESGCRSARLASLQFTPQTPAYTLNMQEAFDEAVQLALQDDSFSPLPLVTPLWNNQLFVGGFPDVEVLECLRALGITHIINCCEGDFGFDDYMSAEFQTLGISATDKEDYEILFHHYSAFAEFIDGALQDPKAKIYVHCIAGVNRSVVLCAAYLIENLGLSPIEAYRCFRDNGRDRVLSNSGFRRQLIDFFFEMQQPIEVTI